MKKVLFTISALAVAGFMFSGCDETVADSVCIPPCTGIKSVCHVNPMNSQEGRCGGACNASEVFDYATGYCVTSTVEDCTINGRCEDGYVCNTDTKRCEREETTKPVFKFVRIDDMSTVSESHQATREDPGADIDAVVLKKAVGGQLFYAEDVKGYRRGDGKFSVDDKDKAFDTDAILHAPDSFVSYPDSATCNYYTKKPASGVEKVYTFVSLAGKPTTNAGGGFIIVEMGDKIEVGDQLDVLEVGKCALANTTSDDGKPAIAEEIKVSISIAYEMDGTWVALKTGTGIVSHTITAANLK